MSLPAPFTRERLGDKLYDETVSKENGPELCAAILEAQKTLPDQLRALTPGEIPDSLRFPCKMPYWVPYWYDQYGGIDFRNGLHGENPLFTSVCVSIGNTGYGAEIALCHKSRAETIEFIESEAFPIDTLVRLRELSVCAWRHEDDHF